MESLVSQSLDRYELVCLLGEGGMGAVFKARDVTLQRDVAVKVMHPQFARHPDFRERFLQEARSAARLDHPGIVAVHDFGQARNHLYIVMELIPGANLRQMLQDLQGSRHWIILPEAIQLVRQVCLAVDYAHKQGVLHRDIKPDNIMLKPAQRRGLPYQPILTDLGLAKLAEGGLLTAGGTSLGTPAYMSPEQALGKETDARSDVYSLGILLYELAVGRLPFRVKTITEAIRAHTKEPPPPPRSIRPDLPEPVQRVILRALEKEPANRFRNAQALAEALAGILPETSIATAPPTALEGTVSLMTCYQQSLVEERGPSILEEFPDAPADLGRDRIAILMPDGTVRSAPTKTTAFTIGRGAGNDLVIDHASISRRHVRIEFDGTNYQITDLDSTNGTFLANAKLLPGVPEAWTPDKAVRIGKLWLRLERSQPAADGTALFGPDGTLAGSSMIHSSPGAGRVGLFMEVAELTVTPGSSATASLVILNQGPVVDHFQTSVKGVPTNWVPALPLPVRLMPGAQQAVSLTIQPPRDPGSRAGCYPLTVQVASQDTPDQVAAVKRTLTVEPYSQFHSSLQPQQVRAGKPARVTVQNQGNLQETYTLCWQDRADELDFEPPLARLRIAEGKAAVAEFCAAPRRQRLIGSQRRHAFTAHVSPAGGEAQTHSGEVVSSARFPAWLLLAFIFLCACLAVATGLGFRDRWPPGMGTAIALETANAAGTATATEAILQPTRTTDPDPGRVPTLTATSTPTPTSTPTSTPEPAPPSTPEPAPPSTPTPTPVPNTSTPPEPPPSPNIGSFQANPELIKAGECTALEWNEPINATSASIDHGVGRVDMEGPLRVCPAETTTYVITVVGPGGTATASATVTVFQPPHIGSFRANPDTIDEGACTELRWGGIANGINASIDNGVGGVGVDGPKRVCPAETTTYVMTVQGLGGSATASAKVTVIPKGTISALTAEYDWSAGWTTARVIYTTGGTYLFMLKKEGSGADGKNVHIEGLHSDGSIGDRVAGYGWTEGWTTAESFTLGMYTYLFMLKASDFGTDGNNVHIYVMNSNGSVGDEVAAYRWSQGWTIAEFFPVDNTTYLFLMKNSGNVHIHEMNHGGSVGERVAEYRWSQGWTTAEFYSVGDTTYLFLMKDSGSVHIHEMNRGGSVGNMLVDYQWTEGWTTAEFYSLGSRTYMLLLKETGVGRDDKNVHIHRINENGTVGKKVAAYKWSEGWTTAEVYWLGFNTYLFSLRESDGRVQIHRIVPD
jgi:tRNA A-37 threonylcarbamoyl transferase component Bud32